MIASARWAGDESWIKKRVSLSAITSGKETIFAQTGVATSKLVYLRGCVAFGLPLALSDLSLGLPI
jgi:hypothetical protein